MSSKTRGAVWIVRAAFLAALGVELLAIHFPAPDFRLASEARTSTVWRFR